MSEQRLSKIIASRGLASRREAEVWLAEGRVTVNGKTVTEQGSHADDQTDDIRLDGKPLPEPPPLVYYLLYKPRGYLTGRGDPEAETRPSVLDLVEHLKFRVEPVGRLDFDTEGALLLTNDGDLAHALNHPSSEVPKRYLAKVYRTPDRRDLDAIHTGVFLEDGKTAPAKARISDSTDTDNAWVEVTVTETKNRLIHRMFAKLGHPVSKLRRESFGTVSISRMERGDVRALTPDEVRRLRDIAEGRKPKSAGKKRRGKGFAKPKPKPKRILGQKKRRAAQAKRKK